MACSYLFGKPWAAWSREERFFCAALFEHARKDANDFAQYLGRETGIELPSTDWELGYEVCFYRDYLWHLGKSARQLRLSAKRTFDLCLFSEECIVVIEAKAWEAFNSRQNEVFFTDAGNIRHIIKRPAIDVKVVALASSLYFQNADRFGNPRTLEKFDGRLTWLNVGRRYPDPIFENAEKIYKLRPGELCTDFAV